MWFENRFIPTRMAQGGVPTHDACLTQSNGAPLALGLAPFTSGETAQERRESLKPVRQHQLYPILGPLVLDPLPATTRQAWIASMHTSGYRPDTTTVHDYYRMMGVSVGLFADIRPIVRLACDLRSADLLLHYLFAVSLQYYLIVRRAWARVRTDAQAPFHERLAPYVFQLFKNHDWVCTAETLRAAPALERDWSNLEEEAGRQPLPVFVFQVVRWVMAWNACDNLPAELEDACFGFCHEKLRKNFVQALTCMRFREWVPSNLLERLGEGATSTHIKFFAHPKACRMPSVTAAPGSDTPQWFCHVSFAPDTPVLATAVEEDRRVLLLRLLSYYPLTMFQHAIQPAAKKLWPNDAILPAHDVADVSPVRARFCMYFEGNRAYAHVPNLHSEPYDEADVRYLSRHAWEWCVARGRYLNEHEPPVKRELDGTEQERQYLAIVNRPPVRDQAWFYFQAVRYLTGSEERAIAACGATHAQLCDSQVPYLVRAFQVMDEASVRALDATWDRCLAMGGVHEYACFARFPASVIAFGGVAWVDAWRPPPSPEAVALEGALAQVAAILSRKSVQRALDRLDPHTREAVRVLCNGTKIETDVVMSDGSSSSSSDHE